MKIVLISPAHPLRGGIAASAERVAQSLQALGHDCVIYSYRAQYPAFLFPGKTQYTDAPPPRNVAIRTVLHAYNPFNWFFSARQIVRERPDIVVARFWLPFMGPCLGTILRLCGFFSNKKTRFTGWIDNILPHEKRPGDRLFTRFFTHAVDDFVVMSRAVEAELRDFVGPGRVVRYAPHPLYDNYGPAPPMPESRARLGLDAHALLVLFFGFIRAYKGLDLLLQALADPRLEALGVQALIAGEPYEDWAPYERLIREGGLERRVREVQDYIPESEVGLYFAAADLAVQPYKSATQSGITQIAFHYGLPVVVTDVGGLREVVDHEHNGYVVQPDPHAIADAIFDFFEKKRGDEMRRAVRKSAAKYSWENLALALLSAENGQKPE